MIYIFLRKLSSSPEWVSLLCLVSYCSQQLIETRVCEKVAAVAFLEVYSVFVREYGNGFRFLFVPGGGGGAEFPFAFAWHVGKGDLQSMFAFLLLLFSHKGARETRVTSK